MGFYWSLYGVPEFANMPRAQRSHLTRVAWLKLRRQPRFWLLFILCPNLPTIVCLGLSFYARLRPPNIPIAPFVLMTALMPALGTFIANHFFFKAALPIIRAELGGLCTQCGYDIRATAARCPECGHSPLS